MAMSVEELKEFVREKFDELRDERRALWDEHKEHRRRLGELEQRAARTEVKASVGGAVGGAALAFAVHWLRERLGR